MSFAIWMLVVGVLLITITLSGTTVRRMPLSPAMLYLCVGIALGPAGWSLMSPDPLRHSLVLERVTELAVLVSLFAAGLKLGLPFAHPAWRLPLRLALVSMLVTVALVALIGTLLLKLPLGGAVLLGAILAPTDPVLASDVQVTGVTDHDQLRFSLTAEGGLNDGAAFPLVMLGLGLLGLHDLGAGLWRWLAVDVAWAVTGGLIIGASLGLLVGKFVVHLRETHGESVGLDEFLALGLIAISYGVAVLCHTYGFLSVFAAGLALQRVGSTAPEQSARGLDSPEPMENDASMMGSDRSGACALQEVRIFNAQIERVAEMGIVLVVGAMLVYIGWSGDAAWLVLALLLVVRPLAVWLGLLGVRLERDQRILIGWFGIRGIGSLYYLMYAINHGVSEPLAEHMATLTLSVVAFSIVIHGISVTPLMRLYTRRK